VRTLMARHRTDPQLRRAVMSVHLGEGHGAEHGIERFVASLAERRDLDDEAARRALLALTTRPSADGGARERIAYRDLGVEQLGTVYETLLDYEPKIERAARPTRPGARVEVSLERGSGVSRR